MSEIALNEVETDAYRCLDCGRWLTAARSGPLWFCAYHYSPLYFRIDANDRVVDFRIGRRAAPTAPAEEDGGAG